MGLGNPVLGVRRATPCLLPGVAALAFSLLGVCLTLSPPKLKIAVVGAHIFRRLIMRRCPWIAVFSFGAGLLLGVSGGDVRAQVDKQPAKQETKAGGAKNGAAAKQVDLVTVDHVELKGKFYPSAKGKEAPCVLLLHALGENSNNKETINFAKRLQEKGFAVFTFDYRGHGDSTTVQPGMPNKNPQLAVRGFWDEYLNQVGVKGYAANKPRPTEIKYEQFNPTYYTVLCNDIQAAKAYLDESDCNSNNLIVIGINDGATLGGVWLNSEFHRFRLQPPGPGYPKGYLDRQNPEGLAVTGAVWITISPTLGKNKTYYNLATMLESAAKVHKVPMLFVYGEGDDKGKKIAKDCEKLLVPTSTKKEGQFTGAKAIKGAEKLSGRDLLIESKDTVTQILDYLESLPPRKMATVPKRTGDETYVWEYVNTQNVRVQATARKPGAKLPEFSGYSSFFR
jgi:hypothetical protein